MKERSVLTKNQKMILNALAVKNALDLVYYDKVSFEYYLSRLRKSAKDLSDGSGTGFDFHPRI